MRESNGTNSSVCSFRSEIKVLIAVLSIIVGLELSLHLTGELLSGNIRHIRSIIQISNRLSESDGTCVLFLGNSLTADGVDSSILESELEGSDVTPLAIEKVTPDGTNLWDWYFIFKNYFAKRKNLPDVLIICFAWEELNDATPFNAARLGGYFCSLGDFPELLELGLSNFKDRAEFSISWASLLFANRETIRNRLLKKIIPYFQEYTRKINDMLIVEDRGDLKQLNRRRYIVLGRLLELLKRHKVQIIFAALPVVKSYNIDGQLREILEKTKTRLLDCRDIPELSEKMFLDPIHLNDNGSKIFSHYLAQRLAETLSGVRKESLDKSVVSDGSALNH